MKPKFTAGSLQYNPKTRDIWKTISDQAYSAIGKFMDVTMSEDELASAFQNLAHGLFESTAWAGYPIPLLAPYQEQACTEAIYDEFRQKILSIAVQRNNDGGINLTQKIFYTGRTWAAYTDENGIRRGVSKDVIFQKDKSDLMNVGALLNFGTQKEHDPVNQFLKNLQLYPKSYFMRIGVGCSFDRTI